MPPAPPVRPRLKPGLRRLWRDGTTLQLGLDPAQAVVITGLGPDLARLVERLDGCQDLAGLRATGEALGLAANDVDDLLQVLGRSGVLEDAADGERWSARLDLHERDRLAPDLAAASLARAQDGGAAVLARRARAAVSVHGAGRVGAPLAALLAAAGVRCVVVEDAATVRPADLAPGGLQPEHVGGRRQDAAARVLRRAAGAVRTHLPAGRRSPDLTVLAVDAGLPDPRLGERLVRAGVPHLYAGVRDVTGVVGPLVLPGRSSCGRCHDLHRCDRDPAWPSIAAQLTGPRRAQVEPCDVVLAAAVAAHAALQVLAHLDGDPAPPAVDGTLEIRQTDGRVRRRSWTAHPACGCSWPQQRDI